MTNDAAAGRQVGGCGTGGLDVLAELGGTTMVYRCLNDSAWTMVWASVGCREVTGHDPGDLIGNRVISYTELILPQDRLGVSVGVQTALAEGRPFQLDYRIRRADGSVARVFEIGLGMLGDSGAVESIQGVIAYVGSA
jgi:PAS domain-containing protein